MITVTQIASELKDFFEKTKADSETFLTTHAPTLANLAEKIETDPLSKLVLNDAEDAIPAELRAPLAKVVQDFVDAYASKPAPVAAEPAEVADPAAVPAA